MSVSNFAIWEVTLVFVYCRCLKYADLVAFADFMLHFLHLFHSLYLLLEKQWV